MGARESGPPRMTHKPYEFDPGHPGELEYRWLLGIFKAEGVRSYLEIGSRYGDSLRYVAKRLPRGSRIVSVDWPGARWGYAGSGTWLKKRVAELNRDSYDAHVFLGDSKDPDIIAAVKALGPFDAVHIDGDHSYDGVTADWGNYGPMGRIVTFHDISWKRPQPQGRGEIEVPRFWKELKASGRYRTDEKSETPNKDRGIGVVWT